MSKHERRNFQRAFTLAETLITLGIIGVVAALTIPTLLTKCQDMILGTQFKQAYSYIINGRRLAIASMGYHPACYYKPGSTGDVSECPEFSEELLKSLKVFHDCGQNAIKNKCIPDYKGWDEVKKIKNPDISDEDLEQAMTGCHNFKKSNLETYPAYYLANGMIIMPGVGGKDYIARNTIIDINGVKGPNKWGFDVFYLYNYYDGKEFYILGGGCQPTEEGGKSVHQMLRSK
ncbi:MAG: type II secretion system GspH family protein [Muribaculaceae bacterium]|nr:type II secretion system GspH family protein [Muribaculaceae bacterium]